VRDEAHPTPLRLLAPFAVVVPFHLQANPHLSFGAHSRARTLVRVAEALPNTDSQPCTHHEAHSPACARTHARTHGWRYTTHLPACFLSRVFALHHPLACLLACFFSRALADDEGGRRPPKRSSAKKARRGVKRALQDEGVSDDEDLNGSGPQRRSSRSSRDAGPAAASAADDNNGLDIAQEILTVLMGHDCGQWFLDPVKKKDAPDYNDIIDKPMDLGQLRVNLKRGMY
jgi:hypothetical protein